MSELRLLKETRGILQQMEVIENKKSYLCSVLRVMQLRHQNIDTTKVIKVIKRVLND